MASTTIRFSDSDFSEALPAEGYHPALVSAARLRNSAAGNTTLQVVYRLPSAEPGFDQVIEYFVLDGAEPRAQAISRRRLLGLCRACGLEPKRGETLELRDLLEARLQLRLGHEDYEGARRVRVLGHRRHTS